MASSEHSFKSKRCNRVIEDLRRWNEDLRRSLEQSEVPAENNSRKVEDLKRRFSIQQVAGPVDTRETHEP